MHQSSERSCDVLRPSRCRNRSSARWSNKARSRPLCYRTAETPFPGRFADRGLVGSKRAWRSPSRSRPRGPEQRRGF
jgi:hypothetical protein